MTNARDGNRLRVASGPQDTTGPCVRERPCSHDLATRNQNGLDALCLGVEPGGTARQIVPRLDRCPVDALRIEDDEIGASRSSPRSRKP